MHPLKVCIKLFWRIARMAVLLFHILKHLLAISQQNKIHTIVKNFLVKMNDLLKSIWKDLVPKSSLFKAQNQVGHGS